MITKTNNGTKSGTRRCQILLWRDFQFFLPLIHCVYFVALFLKTILSIYSCLLSSAKPFSLPFTKNYSSYSTLTNACPCMSSQYPHSWKSTLASCRVVMFLFLHRMVRFCARCECQLLFGFTGSFSSRKAWFTNFGCTETRVVFRNYRPSSNTTPLPIIEFIFYSTLGWKHFR